MGRRATRRRHKKKYNQHQQFYSDPENIHDSQTSGKETGRKPDHWDSLDDLSVLDYASNATSNDPATIRDEMEVTKRLSNLNVSMACFGNDPCALMTSDVETIYSEFPPSATLVDNLPGEFVPLERLKERQYRKRSSKRSRKRTKKAKGLPVMSTCRSLEEGVVYMGKHRKSTQVSKLRFNPISWVHPTRGSSTYNYPGSEPSEAQRCSDESSRCLTDTESIVLDDIIMVGSDQEDEIGFHCMEGLESKSFATPPLNTDSVSTRTQSQGNSESESCSDSGCDGDDEESSVEVTGCLKINTMATTSNSRRGLKPWHGRQFDDKGFSSAEEFFEDEQVPNKDAVIQQWLPGINVCSEFKHPQQWGIKGRVNSTTQHKQPVKKKLVPTIASPHDLSNRIKDFVQLSVELEMSLPMMSRALCRTANSLADLHNLDCVIHQKRRLPVASPLLRKTCCTRLASESEIEGVLKNHRQEVINSVLSPQKHRRTTLPIHVPVSVLASNVKKKLVGNNAPPIGEGNIGNQLLQGMGWKPGSGLGRNENGIQDPLFAEIRPKTAGLGYA